MEEQVSPPLPSFWSQLRFKVIAPYLVLALLLAVAASYFLAQVFAERLYERLLNQLWQAGHYATDEVVYVERELLTSLRAIAYTQGVSEALQQQDQQRLSDLACPIALNAGLDLVHIVTLDGTAVLSLRRDTTSESPGLYYEESGFYTGDWPVCQQVVAGHVDDIGDKFADLVHTPWGWTFYISGPIKNQDGYTVGVVLVGMDLQRLIHRMAGRPLFSTGRDTDLSLSREVTVYGPDGQVLATTLQEASRLQLAPTLYQQVLEQEDFGYLTRKLELSGELVEAFGAFESRHGADMAVFSVALPGVGQEQVWPRLLLTLLFSLAVVAVVLVGLWVSAQIVRPIQDLVSAASQVESGDLSRKIVVRSTDEIGVLAHAFNRMVQGLRVKEFIRDAFGRFVSRDVSEGLLSGSIRVQGEKRVVSMLFSDIRDFTRLSEQYDPAVMVHILNEYFAAMVEVAKQQGGTVNKFGGDSTLVVFGAPVYHPDHADRAVRTALGMRRRMAQLNAERLTRGEVPIRMGIGINTGDVVAGTVGSKDRMEYTVIGDSVNLSARIQGLNKEFPEYDILVSEYTYEMLKDKEQYVFRNLGLISLKGKSEPVRIYAVEGIAEQVDVGA
ncbi:MAG: HAMP domain-containing protein [Chloroflexia bacterium]|nr:HAMP domain-containing protein [Chloroflexia bacterium]